MKITGTSGYIKIEFDYRTVKIQGEMIQGGFAAYKDSMKSWDPPHQDDTFDEEIRNRIIKNVNEYCKESSSFKIEFD